MNLAIDLHNNLENNCVDISFDTSSNIKFNGGGV